MNRMNGIEFEFACSSGQMLHNHFHDFLEIYYLREGQRYYFIKNNTYLVMPGDLIIIRENLLHKTFAAGIREYERYLINIDRQFMMENLEQFNTSGLFEAFDSDIFVIKKASAEIEMILKKMHDEELGLRQDHEARLRLFSLTLDLLFEIKKLSQERFFRQDAVTHVSQAKSLTCSAANSNQVSRHILEITEYINENYDQDLTLSLIAQKFNLSRYYLCKLFSRTTGFSLTEYLHNVRIKEAKLLLANSNLRISEIAERTGYNDVTYFCRVFKKLMGMSPVKYRNGG
jgi:YesN/AraC family two-component response regulator